MSESNYNEIILNPSGNTYVGPLAQRFAIGRIELPDSIPADDSNFHVYEVMGDNRVVYRATEATRLNAQSHMTPERVCVYNYWHPTP